MVYVTEEQDVRDGQRVVAVRTGRDSYEEKVNLGVRIVWFLVGLVVAFLLLRVVLALLGANLENQFASFVYDVTDPLVLRFRGLLQVSQVQAGVSRFELETLVAAIVYTLAGWGVASMIHLLSKKV